MFRMTWGTQVLLMAAVILLVMPNGAAAFGAGNIPSIGSHLGSEICHIGILNYSDSLTADSRG